MFNPSFDRTYWRQADDRRLIEAARESNHELAIALGERLEDRADCPDIIADLIAERDELDKRCDMLRKELNELHEALKGAGVE
jgi:phage shock protein A